MASQQQSDPLTLVDDLVCQKIFNFLCEPVKGNKEQHNYGIVQTMWLRKIAREVHSPLRSVNKRWKEMFDRNLQDAVGPIALDLYETEIFIPRFIRWLGLHPGFQLSSLSAPKATVGDISLLCKLITENDTRQLTSFSVGRIQSGVGQGDPRRPVYDLGNGILVSEDNLPSQQKDLQTLLAQKCPRLVKLVLPLILTGGRVTFPECIQQELFSSPSIEKLTIHLETRNGSNSLFASLPKEASLLTQLVQNLTGLTNLRITLCRFSLFIEYDGRAHIASKSLEHVELEDFIGPVSLDCPLLKTLHTRDNKFANHDCWQNKQSRRRFCCPWPWIRSS